MSWSREDRKKVGLRKHAIKCAGKAKRGSRRGTEKMGAISGGGRLLFPQPKFSNRCLPMIRPPQHLVFFHCTAKARRTKVQFVRSQSLNCSGCLLFPQPKSSDRCLPTIRPPQPHVFFPSTAKARRAKVQLVRSQSINSGEDDNKAALDAFFLGKAFAEALTERVESTVGEFLSVIGQWQAEQQKQVQSFQEEVLERAKKAKEKAAREAMAGQTSETKSLTAFSGNENLITPSSDATKPT